MITIASAPAAPAGPVATNGGQRGFWDCRGVWQSLDLDTEDTGTGAPGERGTVSDGPEPSC